MRSRQLFFSCCHCCCQSWLLASSFENLIYRSWQSSRTKDIFSSKKLRLASLFFWYSFNCYSDFPNLAFKNNISSSLLATSPSKAITFLFSSSSFILSSTIKPFYRFRLLVRLIIIYSFLFTAPRDRLSLMSLNSFLSVSFSFRSFSFYFQKKTMREGIVSGSCIRVFDSIVVFESVSGLLLGDTSFNADLLRKNRFILELTSFFSEGGLTCAEASEICLFSSIVSTVLEGKTREFFFNLLKLAKLKLRRNSRLLGEVPSGN